MRKTIKKIMMYTLIAVVALSVSYNTSYADENSGADIPVAEPTVNVAVKAVWDDESDKDGIRPDSITVTLTANGNSTDKTLTLSEANGWAGTFTGLAEADETGAAIGYGVTAGVITGYYTTTSGSADAGYVITNYHTPMPEDYVTPEDYDDTTKEDAEEDNSGDVEEPQENEEPAAEENDDVDQQEAEEEVKAEESDKSPQTGDDSMAVWFAAAILAAAAMTVALRRRTN